MPDARRTLTFAALLIASASLSSISHARESASTTNPLAGRPAAIAEGASLFRAYCSPCHGSNAAGGTKGPGLHSGQWTHGSSDSAIFRTIAHGVPGTEMPANELEDSEIWSLIAYLRSLAPARQSIDDNTARGAQLFSQSLGCSGCHMVNGKGGVLGPDLSRVGASRSLQYLIDSIRDPDKELSAGTIDPNDHYGLPLVYDTTTVVTRAGETVIGIVKNEDTFSIQLIDNHQALRLFLKQELREVRHDARSLMPAYSADTLSDAQLKDLVAYLQSLRP